MLFDNIEANIGFKNLKPGLKFERKLLETRTKVPKHSFPSFFFFLRFQKWVKDFSSPQISTFDNLEDLFFGWNLESTQTSFSKTWGFFFNWVWISTGLNWATKEGDDLRGKKLNNFFYDSRSQLSSSLFFHRCRRPLISPLFRSKAQIPSLPTKSSIFGR